MDQSIKGCIFDLDGTLVDSMWVWQKVDVAYIAEKQLDITPEQLMMDIAHFSFDETAHYFKRTFGITDSTEDIKKTWTTLAEKEYSSNVFLKAGAKSFLEQLKAKGVKLAMATSNSRHLLTVALTANGILDLFDTLVTTSESSANTKEEPDVYLLAAEKLGLKPQECMVFEDVPKAMMGAKKAGMRVIAISDGHSQGKEEEIQELAELFLEDFTSLLDEAVDPKTSRDPRSSDFVL